MPPYQAKIPIVKFGVPLVSVQLEFSTIYLHGALQSVSSGSVSSSNTS